MASKTMTASAATDTLTNGMKIMSLDYNHDTYDQHNYCYYDYPDDTNSDSTVTAIVKDLSLPQQHHGTEKTSNTNNTNDWIDEIEHSFESSCNDNNYSLDDFNETTIMQSYLEPDCYPDVVTQQQPTIKQRSRLSFFKSKVKRAFCISSGHQQQSLDHGDKKTQKQRQQQALLRSSLPVFPTTQTSSNHTRWNSSIDSSICSSSTLRPTPDQTSTHSNTSNISSYKSHPYRHSCGFNTANSNSSSNSSSPFIQPSKPQQDRKRHSAVVSRIKNRFSRTSSLGTLPISVPAPPIKGILKKQTSNNVIDPCFNQQRQQQHQKRLSTTRFSVGSRNKERCTFLSPTNNNNNNSRINKRISQSLNQQLQQQQHYRGPKMLRFNEFIDIQETYAKEDYDRSSDPDAVCMRLTAAIATQIKQELNEFKVREMIVHDSCRKNTHFFL